MKNIRNFCIIAHIDHGKSTLADRLLEYTKTIAEKDLQDQVLDNMDLERERGITIKSHAIQMEYLYQGEKYILNLIDTPGHVDFSYEVSRSIAACEGALLIVDASQGIQAQTISNLYMAIEHDLEIIPVINKIDLESARPDEVEDQIVELLGCKREEIIRASGKTGQGVEEILAAIIERIEPPKGDVDAPLQCLIFDSVFNSFRGIIAYFKICNGRIRTGDKVKFVATGKEYEADEIGVLKLDMVPRNELLAGDVGYIISGIKTSREVKVGDTITHIDPPVCGSNRRFEEVKPMVFAVFIPSRTEDFENLRSSLEKLQLKRCFAYVPARVVGCAGLRIPLRISGAAPHGDCAGASRPRVQYGRDYDRAHVSYKVYDKKGGMIEVHNPSGLPDPDLDRPHRGALHPGFGHHGYRLHRPHYDPLLGKRGELVKQEYISGNRVEIIYDMPLGEIVIDFYDKLKSISKGYASFDYHIHDFRESKLVKLDILLNGESVDACRP